ncbi:MAG: hypothetical protein ABR973_07820 [Candidatus Acidiferrales bacterium]|jgi:hypothetical protein
MRFVSRCCAILVAASLLHSPVRGGQGVHGKPVGVVSQANQAYLGTANAVTGADVYDCENLETTDKGELRLQVRSGQVYLSASSSAQLEQDINETQVFVNRGTVGFSAPAASGIELTTPAGFIRAANGQAAAGEVAFTGPKEMTVSAIRGDLVLDNGGEFRTISEGKSAKITFEDAPVPSCRVDEAANQNRQPYVHHRIGFMIVAAAAVAVPAFVIWHEESESNSTPPQ